VIPHMSTVARVDGMPIDIEAQLPAPAHDQLMDHTWLHDYTVETKHYNALTLQRLQDARLISFPWRHDIVALTTAAISSEDVRAIQAAALAGPSHAWYAPGVVRKRQ
jgi:hypothetical protein